MVLALLVVSLAIRMGQHPLQRGDGAEYFCMTRSLVTQGDLVIEPEETEIFQHPDSPWPLVRLLPHEAPLVEGKDGRERCLHSPIVSILAVPFYWLGGLINPHGGQFRCFSILGLFGVLVSAWLLSRYWENRRPSRPQPRERMALRFLAFAAVFFSTANIYAHWVHSEASVFLLLCLYFYWLSINAPIPAALALGLAAGQNNVCILWSLILFGRFIAMAHRRFIRRETVPGMLGNFVALLIIPLPALALAIQNYILYGTPSLLARFGSGVISLITIGRVVRFYIDPFFGLIWFCPWVFLGVFSPCGWRRFLVRFAVSLPVAAMSMSVTNLNSHMVGLRYLMFVYPAFLFLPVSIPRMWPIRLLFALYIFGCLYVGAPFLFNRADSEKLCETINNDAYVGINLVFGTIPALYNPEPEMFLENTHHKNVRNFDNPRERLAVARVSHDCWFIYVEKKVLPPGKAALILERRGGPQRGMASARFGIGSSLRLKPVEIKRNGDYRLEFTVRPGDYDFMSLWGEYVYLKYRNSGIEPVAIELSDGSRIALDDPIR